MVKASASIRSRVIPKTLKTEFTPGYQIDLHGHLLNSKKFAHLHNIYSILHDSYFSDSIGKQKEKKSKVIKLNLLLASGLNNNNTRSKYLPFCSGRTSFFACLFS